MRVQFPKPTVSIERGAAIVEFALVTLIFIVFVLGIMEFGRMFYVLNTVQEVTRRAARAAVVENFNSEVDAVRRYAVLRAGSTGTVHLPAAPEISSTSIQINYLNGTLAQASPLPLDPADNLSACNDVTRTSSCIRFVETCVATNGDCTGTLTYAPMVSLFPFLAISIPVSSVVMPAESLGFNASS
jgi:energy-converting hydrogenase Eha subunit E